MPLSEIFAGQYSKNYGGYGEKKLRNLFKYLDEQDVPILRKHGNIGRTPQNKLSSEKTKQIEVWINDFAQRIACPLRRNIVQNDKKQMIFLPACYTITMLFELCINDFSKQSNIKFSRYTFYSILTSDVCNHIRVSSPKTDTCETCDLLRMELNSIKHALPYQEGQEIPLPSIDLSNHLFLAHSARNEYFEIKDVLKMVLLATFHLIIHRISFCHINQANRGHFIFIH